MEHIIELNSKVDKLMTKHKKLKRKYQTLSADIYVDDNEESCEHSLPPHGGTTPNEPTENKNKTQPDEEPKNSPQTITTKHLRTRSSWRNQLNYL